MYIDYESKELMSHVGNFHTRFARKVDAGSKLDLCDPLNRSVLNKAILVFLKRHA